MRKALLKMELLAATFVLTVAIAGSPLLFRKIQNLRDTSRIYQLAIQELSNHMESLTRMTPSECEEALDSIVVSSELKQQIPESSIHGQITQDGDAWRILLSFQLPVQHRREPIELYGWLFEGDKR